MGFCLVCHLPLSSSLWEGAGHPCGHDGPWPGPRQESLGHRLCDRNRALQPRPCREGEGRSLAPAPLSLPNSVPAPWLGPSMPCGLPQASACPLFPPPLPPPTPLARARLTQLPHLVDLGKPLFIHPSNGTITSPPHRLVGASMQRGGGVACPSATHTLSPHVTSTPFLCIFARHFFGPYHHSSESF